MKRIIKISAPFLILVLAFVGFKILASLKPAPKNQVPPPVVPLVEQIIVSPEDHAPPVRSYGTVESFFETELTSQVSGQITEVSEEFQVGKKVKSGQVLVKIDPTDYIAAVAREESNLTIAERTLAEEEIRAAQAAGDWEASGRKLSSATDFVLRKPQLAAARASIESAKAAIAKARADLERTEVRAPFDAVVTARDASPGNQASAQSSLGTLVATRKVEVRLPLMPDQLPRVTLPTTAELTSPLKPGITWQAKLERLEPSVDRQNQVMYAVAEVDEPFADDAKSLPIGIFANARIVAQPVPNTYRVPEAAFVSDRFVWVIDSKNQLKRVDATRMMNFEGDVYLKLAQEGSAELRIVTRPLSNFREGMKVKTPTTNPE